MPAELLSLKEQLQNIQVVYLSAVEHNKPNEDLEKLRNQIVELQERIIQREEMLAQREN